MIYSATDSDDEYSPPPRNRRRPIRIQKMKKRILTIFIPSMLKSRLNQGNLELNLRLLREYENFPDNTSPISTII